MSMDKLPGQKLSLLDYPDIHKVADLTYLDGPLLSLFRDFEGQNYLYHWCDSDDTYNRWLVLRITDQQFAAYIKQSITLRKVIVNAVNNEIYVVDIDGKGHQQSILLTRPDLLPEDYLPREGTLYDPDVSIFYEQEICREGLAILLDENKRLRQSQRIYTSQTSFRPSVDAKNTSGFEPNNATHINDILRFPISAMPKSRPFGTPLAQKQ